VPITAAQRLRDTTTAPVHLQILLHLLERVRVGGSSWPGMPVRC